MSNFIRRTKNPATGEFEDAAWLDNYYGGHRYGVRFPSQGQGVVYKADNREWEFEEPKEEPKVKITRRKDNGTTV